MKIIQQNSRSRITIQFRPNADNLKSFLFDVIGLGGEYPYTDSIETRYQIRNFKGRYVTITKHTTPQLSEKEGWLIALLKGKRKAEKRAKQEKKRLTNTY